MTNIQTKSRPTLSVTKVTHFVGLDALIGFNVGLVVLNGFRVLIGFNVGLVVLTGFRVFIGFLQAC